MRRAAMRVVTRLPYRIMARLMSRHNRGPITTAPTRLQSSRTLMGQPVSALRSGWLRSTTASTANLATPTTTGSVRHALGGGWGARAPMPCGVIRTRRSDRTVAAVATSGTPTRTTTS